jgi:hypothetical protein
MKLFPPPLKKNTSIFVNIYQNMDFFCIFFGVKTLVEPCTHCITLSPK